MNNVDARAVDATCRLLHYLNELNQNEGMFVSGAVETEAMRIYFAPDEDGSHGITGAGPK